MHLHSLAETSALYVWIYLSSSDTDVCKDFHKMGHINSQVQQTARAICFPESLAPCWACPNGTTQCI